MNKLCAGFVFAILVTIAGAADPSQLRADDSTGVESHPWIGTTAPDFRLERVGGGQVSLAEFRGKFLVIHFGASW